MKISFTDSTIENLTINQFNSGAMDTGPLTETITIPCSKQFKELVEFVSRLTNREISELGHRYLLEGMTKDIKNVFSVVPYLDKSLREVLDKKPPGKKEGNTQGLR